jgi:hypothetical protein
MLTWIVIGLLAGSTLLAGWATRRNLGAQEFEHPKGISLRQDSVRTSRAGFFPWYVGSRRHRGGGFSGGK